MRTQERPVIPTKVAIQSKATSYWMPAFAGMTKDLLKPSCPKRLIVRRQSGAALVVALILLLVLTILGVSTMNTTSLEEKMAANAQELNRAFHAADSGITQAFRNVDTTDLTGAQDGGTLALTIGGTGKQAGARSVARFVATSDPPLNSGYGVGSGLQAYYFDIQSTGFNLATGTGAATAPDPDNASTVVLSGGIYQMGLK